MPRDGSAERQGQESAEAAQQVVERPGQAPNQVGENSPRSRPGERADDTSRKKRRAR